MPEANEANILTEEGVEKLKEELHYLENDKRSEVAERIKVALGFGDLSENSEYDDAKNEQALMEGRIAEINNILGSAQVVKAGDNKTVRVGSKVTVEMGDKGPIDYVIVGAAEADVKAGRISNVSPVGRALLGAKKGESVTAVGPTGKKIKLKVIKISK
ncbi:MAG: transcription elongation factor GreA [Coriobacteriales bacterium]|jgi:transcription elongation factor GreA|nr:transcription elongation factor GreA [Coriobacteriales bacterium]